MKIINEYVICKMEVSKCHGKRKITEACGRSRVLEEVDLSDGILYRARCIEKEI